MMTFKESGDSLTADELAKMALPERLGSAIYKGQELRLYNKFVREFIGSEKIKRTQRTGALWHVDKKLKHVWKRYCDDDAYKTITDVKKRQIMAMALWEGTGIHHPLEGINVGDDYAKRESPTLTARFNPGVAEKVATGLVEALKDKASLGIYKLVKIASELRDGDNRKKVAAYYAEAFGGLAYGTDHLELGFIEDLDDDAMLGVAAALVALKLQRFTRREATLLAAQTLAVTGNVLKPLGPLGEAFSTAGSMVSSTVTAEQAIRKLAKQFEGNLGIARETAAYSLWGLGNRSHEPALEFMVRMGLLDEDNYMREAGFFDACNMRLASNFIATQIKSTGK